MTGSSSGGALLRVLFVVSEAVPLAKTGGLADVAGALPRALAAAGCDVRVVLPCYRSVREGGMVCEPFLEGLPLEWNGGGLPAEVLCTSLPGRIPCYLIRRDEFYDRSHLYGIPEGDYFDNDLRFIYLCRAVFSVCRAMSWFPDVMHCNDWQTALVAAYLRNYFNRTPAFARTRSLLTIHNLAYQGVFPAGTFGRTGLPAHFFSMEGMEYWGNVNFLKAGIVCADMINTVSPSYSREILTKEFGFGLDGVLSARSRDLHGILNGADYEEWNPESDPWLKSRYARNRMSGKRACKEDLVREFRIRDDAGNSPLFGMITRLASQKGMDLVVSAAKEMMDLGVRFAVLGEGEERYRAECEELGRGFPGLFCVRFGYDDALAHRIQGGSDFILMPSLYEPCGLNQMYAMRYGTVPVVKATGGLRDTVVPFDAGTGEGTGFLFERHSPEALLDAVASAVRLQREGGQAWRRIRSNCMRQRFSWERSAGEYLKLYGNVLEGGDLKSISPGRGYR